MALASKDRIGGSLPPFFKPEDHASDLALVVEPYKVREGVQGRYGPKDHVQAKVAVFRTQESLDKGKPSMELTVEVNATVLARDLKELLEDAKKTGDPAPAMIVTLQHYQPKGGGNKTWVFRQPTDADYAKAADWYAKREAAMQAALADVPDF